MTIELLIIGLLLILIAGSVHGALGFGFPMLSTPVLALAYDLKTAVVLTIIPSLVVIIASLLNCRDLIATIRRYSLIISTVAAASLLGAWVLTWANPNILKLLLALSIFLYLFSNNIKQYSSHLAGHPVLFALVMGSLAGSIGGATNAVAPILMIYLLEVSKSTKEIIIVSNTCFLLSKLMQIAILATHLTTDDIQPSALVMISLAACIGLMVGFSIKNKINAESYKVIIRYVLSLFMCVLGYQGISNLALSL
ncbi:hypothetical protein EDC56_1026 [Sinobacterium caligoides]|uniref:Probable membrane transporter protein n=1 Tax=Sinobacterium caligoides TaxID=933926 RepID=A0A3N2E076_9GAMM|nr:sulfite exporter TauE/SafE family protein [Sinobacterium caligoides]ROS05496.1 hypothetical protein EDC56_1026 [Sinobacterium caligoides]